MLTDSIPYASLKQPQNSDSIPYATSTKENKQNSDIKEKKSSLDIITRISFLH
jgi:hypothetical protein